MEKVVSSSPAQPEVRSLRELSSHQWKSGIAAWLGWLFDGLDMHIYTLVALPFVAELMRLPVTDPNVGRHGALINGAFLVGWALGGAFFGRLGDLLGRSRALCLTILTYAAFTGLSAFATEWWHLLIFRFLGALGIGGEWAVGASLLSETWPKRWRPWIAATLQTAVNLGVLLACFAGYLFEKQPPRWIFLVGVIPALLVLWIRRAVPETEEWQNASANAPKPRLIELFRGSVAPNTWRALTVCAVALTAHWTFMYWHQTHIRNLPEVVNLDAAQKNRVAVQALFLVMFASIIGNYASAFVARFLGYRRAAAASLGAYFFVMMGAYGTAHDLHTLYYWLFAIGTCQGVFGLFTMCLPPLFPTLLRTTGAGFCYNIGRIVAAGGTVFFGVFTKVGDYRMALFYAGFLFIPATLAALLLPEPPDENSKAGPLAD
ncbi:MAG: MFS transporter [Pedosphaera sp.]|nr:MFS transporter [Pedosphaera sp.]